MADLETSVRAIALAARKASAVLARTTTDQRNAALLAMARALREHSAAIVEANAEDMRAGRAAGMSEGLLDRLELNEQRVEGMASALEDLASLSDPVGRVLEERTIEGGMLLQRISVPLGVVAMVYEARPNVTADAAGICLKAGNACVLRGGSQALHSNIALTKVLRDAAQKAGLPADSICSIETADRAATDVLMGLHGLVDVLIPRGGAGLIRHCIEHSKVPVIETGTGNCHVYVHESADFDIVRVCATHASRFWWMKRRQRRFFPGCFRSWRTPALSSMEIPLLASAPLLLKKAGRRTCSSISSTPWKRTGARSISPSKSA